MELNIDTEAKTTPTDEEVDPASRDDEKAKEEKASQLRRFKGWCRMDIEHQTKWRKEADEDFAFVAGHQWSDKDRKSMEDQKRVPIVFNRVLTVVKSIAGSEINGRLDTRFLPRGVEDSQVNELLSAASEWMSDQCDAEDEQSEAFEAALITGMGWTECRFTYDEDPEGMYIEEEIDPREMFWDCKAKKKNLSDSRRRWRLREIPLNEAMEMFPKFKKSDLDAQWLPSLEGDESKNDKPVELQDHSSDEDDDSVDPYRLEKTDVRIVQMQYWEYEPYYVVAVDDVDEMGKPYPLEELDEEDFKAFKQLADEEGFKFESTKMKRRRYRQAFIGNTILDETDCPSPEEFSFNCITGERDRKNNNFFGLVRVMRDPQMWANKMLSNALHIANTTAKGGIIAEKNAFANQRQAEASYAQPDAITWAAQGAIKDQRIMPKPGQGDPSVYMNILEFAIASIRDVTGVNLELLGLRDANQPGILEAQRKQAAMTVLASLFNSLRRFRKGVGRVRLHIIQEYLSDGRLIRIKGEHGGEVKPLNREETLGKYDVIVADAPTSPNQKEATWQLIQQVLPVFKDMLTPEVTLALLEYSPFPTDVVEKLREISAQAQAAMQQGQQEMAELEKQNFMAEIKKLLAGAAKDEAIAQKTRAEAGAGGQVDQAGQMKAFADAEKSAAQAEDIRRKTLREEQDAEIKRAQTIKDTELDVVKAVAEESRTDERHNFEMATKAEQHAQQALLSDAQLEKLKADIASTVVQTLMALQQGELQQEISAGEAALQEWKTKKDSDRADKQAAAAQRKAAAASKEKK